MKVEQLYTGCLAEATYYIESDGEAVVIDPLRETGPYIERARQDGAKIKYVLETHFHADFVYRSFKPRQKNRRDHRIWPNSPTQFSGACCN